MTAVTDFAVSNLDNRCAFAVDTMQGTVACVPVACVSLAILSGAIAVAAIGPLK